MFVNRKVFQAMAERFGEGAETTDSPYERGGVVFLAGDNRKKLANLTSNLDPEGTKVGIEQFLKERRAFIKATFNGQSNVKLEELNNYEPRLKEAFQELVSLIQCMRQSDEPLSPREEGYLSGICDENFSRAVGEYNNELEEAIMVLAENIEEAGVGYLMESPNHYNEEAVRQVEKVLNLMMSGYYALSEGVLSSLSPDYSAMDLNGERERQEDKFGQLVDPSKKDIDYQRIREFERVISDEIVVMAENGVPEAEIRQELMGLIKMGFKSRMDSIASQNLTLFHKYQLKGTKEANRILDRSDASQQLEFLLNLVNQCLRTLPSLRCQNKVLLRNREPIECSA